MPTLAESVAGLSSRLLNLQIPHYIGGSYASSVWGEARATNDIDFVLLKDTIKVESLVNTLAPDYVATGDAVEAALNSRDASPSFAVVDPDSVVFFDCFVASTPFDRACFKNQIYELGTPEGTVPIATAENVFVNKLRWYALGNHVSQQQFRDLRNLLTFNPELDGSGFVLTWVENLGLQNEFEAVKDSLRPSS